MELSEASSLSAAVVAVVSAGLSPEEHAMRIDLLGLVGNARAVLSGNEEHGGGDGEGRHGMDTVEAADIAIFAHRADTECFRVGVARISAREREIERGREGGR